MDRSELFQFIYIESHSFVTFCPVFYLKAYLCCTEPIWEEVVWMFLGNNRQHMPLCACMISSWERKVSSMAMIHMSLDTIWGAAACAVFVA